MGLSFYKIIGNGDLEAFRKNIELVDINIRNENGQSLLHQAVADKYYEIAYELLNKSIDVNIQDAKGMTALHYVGFHPHLELAKRIIEKDADLNIKDLYGNIPLWYVLFYTEVNQEGKYELVELFINHGSDANSVNNVGKTPLDIATRKSEKLVKILQKL